jgi:WD40 repeat protein
MKNLIAKILTAAIVAPLGIVSCYAQTEASLKLIKTFKAHNLQGESLIQVQYSPSSLEFITAASDGKVKVWQELAKEVMEFSQQPPAMLFNGRLEADNTTVITAAYNGFATRWSTKGTPAQSYGPHLSGVTDVELLPNGEGVVTSSDDGSIRLWSDNGKLLKRIETPGVTRHLALASKRDLIAASQDMSTVTILSTKGEVLQTFKAGQGRLNDVIFSPDEQLLLTTGFNGTIKIWELANPHMPPKLKTTIQASETGWINGIALNKKGVLASVGDDGTVRLWNLQGKELAKVGLTNKHILSCSFSPNGEKLLVAIQDGTIAEFAI